MVDFKIAFSQPWLLLILIPAIALTLIPHLRLSKRYRRTRNRITSIALHLVVLSLATFTLAGMTFEYKKPNTENEIIILVDVSESEKERVTARDEFVETLLRECQFDGFKVGVVTFGYDQRYAVPMTYEVDTVYGAYLDALETNMPDKTATNIADALVYSAELFTNPKSGKIVVVTDGKETDNVANDVIRTVSAKGIKVDVAYVPSAYTDDSIQIVEVQAPDYYVGLEEDFFINVIVQAKNNVTARFTLNDNGKVHESYGEFTQTVSGSQKISFRHRFGEDDAGLHKITVEAAVSQDGIEKNNKYTTYINLEIFDNILILERAGESQKLKDILTAENEYTVTVQNINDEGIPLTVDDLRAYDQVILNNISYADMERAYQDKPTMLDEMLEEYVSYYGGGVFTVGGNDGEDANMYKRLDLYGTTYQKMLPVQAINYTPPIGVIFVLDKSGSMTEKDTNGQSYLDRAKAAIANCLTGNSETSEVAVFNPRDYIGLMTLDNDPEVVLKPTAFTEKDEVILKKLKGIENAGGNTIFDPAIRRAGELLRTETRVDKRHIIIVTDGGVLDKGTPYVDTAKTLYESDGITCSVLAVGLTESDSNYAKMKALTDAAGGSTRLAVQSNVTDQLRAELSAPEINEVNKYEEGFSPIINNPTSALVRGLATGDGKDRNKLTVTLNGFYGVKAREVADVVLVGDYEVPIYAQWKYGNGMVGSFMCDLNEKMSASFMQDVNGQRFIKNVVNNLMPVKNIRTNEILTSLTQDNYSNVLEIDAGLQDGERVEATLYSVDDLTTPLASLNQITQLAEGETFTDKEIYVTEALSEATGYTKASFVVKKSGVYKIVINKYVGDNPKPKATLTLYKEFSYSEEYAYSKKTDAAYQEDMQKLATRGNGLLIDAENLDNVSQILASFTTKIARSYDPRTIFMIVAICAFLLDIAVRKFKFKWLHEIIRERKNKKEENQSKKA